MKTYIPFCLLIALAITSCKTYKYIDIQTANPGKVSFPKKNIMLLIADPVKLGKITSDTMSQPYCHLIVGNFNSEIKEQLRNSPMFHDTGIKILQVPTISVGNDTVEKKHYLDSLKNLYAHVKEEVILMRYGFRIAFKEWRFLEYDFSYKFQFVLSNLKTGEIYDSYQISDIRTWAKAITNDNGSKAMILLSKELAESYAQRIAPYWATEERQIISSPNRKMRKAFRYFCNNNLDQAIETWKQLYEIGTDRLSASAAFNIALTYEIKDDLDSCESWLVKSILKKKTPAARTYLDTIRKRKLARVTIDNQL